MKFVVVGHYYGGDLVAFAGFWMATTTKTTTAAAIILASSGQSFFSHEQPTGRLIKQNKLPNDRRWPSIRHPIQLIDANGAPRQLLSLLLLLQASRDATISS